MNYSINSVQGSIHQGSETFSEPSRQFRQCAFMALSALFHNQSIPVHSWTKLVVDQVLHHGDAMEMACIHMHFQTITYPMLILCILRICQWWQILFMVLNLRRDMVGAALHFSLRTTSIIVYTAPLICLF